MKTTAKEIHELDPWKVKVFVHRERDQERFERVKSSIDRRGQLHPGQVRDIRHLPKEKRLRPEGGLYDYGLITGEGRLEAARILDRKFRCFIEDEKENKVVGYFLAENLNREPLPWALKAKLVRPELESGKSVEELARTLDLTPKHIAKFKRILDKVAPELEDEVSRMPMNDAEVFTTLDPEDQKVVMEVARETGEREIKSLVSKAKRVAGENDGKLSKTALKQSLERVDEELKKTREQLKVVRLHWSLSVQNLQQMLKDTKFRAAAKKAGVNLAKFEKAMSII